MGPWRLKSPKICSGQVGDSGEPVVWCLSRSTGLRTRKPDAHINSSPSLKLKMEERCLSSKRVKQREQILSYSVFFYSNPGLDWIRTIHVGEDNLLLLSLPVLVSTP